LRVNKKNPPKVFSSWGGTPPRAEETIVAQKGKETERTFFQITHPRNVPKEGRELINNNRVLLIEKRCPTN